MLLRRECGSLARSAQPNTRSATTKSEGGASRSSASAVATRSSSRVRACLPRHLTRQMWTASRPTPTCRRQSNRQLRKPKSPSRPGHPRSPVAGLPRRRCPPLRRGHSRDPPYPARRRRSAAPSPKLRARRTCPVPRRLSWIPSASSRVRSPRRRPPMSHHPRPARPRPSPLPRVSSSPQSRW